MAPHDTLVEHSDNDRGVASFGVYIPCLGTVDVRTCDGGCPLLCEVIAAVVDIAPLVVEAGVVEVSIGSAGSALEAVATDSYGLAGGVVHTLEGSIALYL